MAFRALPEPVRRPAAKGNGEAKTAACMDGKERLEATRTAKPGN
jgi:hypothetical protein